MRTVRAVAEVTRWEILRYIKLKQQVIGLVMTVVILLGISFAGRVGGDPSSIEIAVIGAEHLPTLDDQVGRFELHRHPPSAQPRLRTAVDERDLAGLLVLDADGEGELYTRHAPGWRSDLERHLTTAVITHRLHESGLDPGTLATIQAPFQLEVLESAPRAGTAERLAAMVALGLMLLGLISGIGYVFSSVTAEKQNRLSEQVVSAIPAQSWIDGKILGLATVSMVIVLNTVIAVGIWLGVRYLIWGDPVPVLESVEHPGLLAVALFFILLGYLFWFTFITAAAALVDDPHTSTRSQLLFLPMLAAAPAFLAIPDPEALWVWTLSIVPPTSSAVMPARLLLADVPWWEAGLAAVLLVVSTLAIRRVAGKVFRLGMLMYGKEPTWAEVRRWVREA
jgi:ABC-2 type transport system permease protein